LINDTQKRLNSGDIIAINPDMREVCVNKDSKTTIKKKLNVPGLISFLLFFLVFPLLLVPWYRLFIFRSNTITTLVIHIVGIFVIGILMPMLGITAVLLARKKKGIIKGTWMGVTGIVVGLFLSGFGGFFIIDYLIRGTV